MVAEQLTLPILVGAALLDSINPCVIGVLILLLTVLLRIKDRRKMLIHGSVYVIGVYATYLLGGLALLSIFQYIRTIPLIATYFYIAIGAFIIFAGLLEFKDFFWYGRWFSLQLLPQFVSTIESYVEKTHASLLASFLFGVLVTLVELPCTGAPYLAILTILSNPQFGFPFYLALLYLLLYNLVFVLPLLVIIYLAYTGTKLKKIEKWRRENKGLMRLLIGLFLIGLGVWIVLFPPILQNYAIHLIGGLILLLIAMAIGWKLKL